MIEYILNYLANRGVYATSQGEQQQMEDGIASYLQENGLEDGVLFKLRPDQRREPDRYRV